MTDPGHMIPEDVWQRIRQEAGDPDADPITFTDPEKATGGPGFSEPQKAEGGPVFTEPEVQ